MTPQRPQPADHPFAEWVVLELMGHRRLAGRLTEQEIAGKGFLRLEMDGATQLYNPASVYCITPTTEETARGVMALNQPAPVQRWELPRPPDHAPPPGAEEMPDDWPDGAEVFGAP